MTAAERAVDLILSGLDRWADEPCDPVDIVERLMADPALLVDLAIEAGGLEPARAARQGPQLHLDPTIASVNWGAATLPTDVPLWVRRTTQENDQ